MNPTGTIVVQHSLARAIPSEVSHLSFYGLSNSREVLFGPETRAKANEIRLQVPVGVSELLVFYSDGVRDQGSFRTAVSVQAGQETTIANPQWSKPYTLDPPNPVLNIGATTQFLAIDEFGIPDKVQWEILNPGLLGIDANGVASGLKEGQAFVIARGQEADGLFRVEVSETVSGLGLSPQGVSLPVGFHQQLIADCSAFFTPQGRYFGATWSSADPGIASVDQNGSVLGVSPGATTIRVTVGSVTATTEVTVNLNSLVSMEVETDTPVFRFAGFPTFRALGTFEDNQIIDISASVSWASSNQGVLVFNQVQPNRGETTGLGTCEITATANFDGGPLTASTSFTVIPR